MIYDPCALAQPGAPCTRLRGMRWLHAATTVGDSNLHNDVYQTVGTHGDELANHHDMGPYGEGYSPEKFFCYMCAFFELPASPVSEGSSSAPSNTQAFPEHLVWRPPADERLRAFSRVDAARGEADIVLRLRPSESLFAVPAGDAGSGCDGQLVQDRLGPELRQRLDEPSRVWVNTVEPVREMGLGSAFPMAFALSENGAQVVDAVRDIDGSLLSLGDQLCTTDADCRWGRCENGFCVARARTGSPDAFGYVPVASRVAGGVFVVGGAHPSTQLPTGEIWFTPASGDSWQLVATGSYLPEKVLAATYSYATNELFVLDEVSGSNARLVAVRAYDGATRTLGSWSRQQAWNRHWLATDLDGAVLLASSNSSGGEYAIARLDARSQTLKLDGIERGPRELLLPPVVDAAGYTLALSGLPDWPAEVVVAENSLHILAGSNVRGDVAVLDAAAGPVLSDGAEAVVGHGARVFGAVRADSVRLRHGAAVAGDIGYNEIWQHGQAHVVGTLHSPLALPLSIALPAMPAINACSAPVVVSSETQQTLAPGAYGPVILKAGKPNSPTVLTLDGGEYAFASLRLRRHTRLECAAACEVWIAGRLRAYRNSYIGPAEDSATLVSSVHLYVAGANGPCGTLHGIPKSARIGRNSTVRARIFAPNGTLWLRQGTSATGTFIARDVRLGMGVSVRKDERDVVRVRKRGLDLDPALLANLGAQL